MTTTPPFGSMSARFALWLACSFVWQSLACADEWIVADRVSNRLLAFDAESGAYQRVVLAEGLDLPAALTIGPGGSLYVANLQLGNVLKVDPQTGTATPFASGIAGPGGLAYDPISDSLFVGEFGNFDGRNVLQFDAQGTLLKTIDAGPTGHGGLAVDDTGDLYVSAFAVDGAFSGAVLKFDAQNGYAPLGVFASGNGLAGANGLAFDAQGDLLVAGLFGQRVVRYDVENGAVVGGGNVSGLLAYPSGISVAPDGTLIATSLGNNNPSDPVWGGNLFPGALYRFNTSTQARSSFLVGDFAGSLIVDGADLATWETAFGTNASADADGDANSDGDDFLAWQRGWGNRGYAGDFQPTALAYYHTTSAGTTIPECASLWNAMAALLVGGAPLRRRAHRAARSPSLC